jgi:hypothetical protein
LIGRCAADGLGAKAGNAERLPLVSMLGSAGVCAKVVPSDVEPVEHLDGISDGDGGAGHIGRVVGREGSRNEGGATKPAAFNETNNGGWGAVWTDG